MKIMGFILMLCTLALSKELTLRSAIELALENNPLIRASQRDLKAQELELRSARGMLFPRLRFEETFTRTDMPSYAFMSRLNQERIGMADFDPSRLNNPKPINNFETKLTLEVPIWLGGKVQSGIRMAEYEYRAVDLQSQRRREEVIKEVYQAYTNAVVAKASLEVSKQAVKDAEEHLRLSESMQKVGMALLSDVLRARVHLSKAQESLENAKRGYELAKKGLELAAGTTLGDFDVQTFDMCPSLTLEGYREKALSRKDIKSLEEKLKVLQESYRFVLSDSLPQVYGFVQYSHNSKDFPLASGGGGYMVGLLLGWTFETGLSTLRKAQANLERKRSLEEQLRFLKDKALFDVERAGTEYMNAIEMLRSAEERIRASEEVLRVISLRYKNGLARMVDLLDAQTELDKARFERVQALGACHRSYSEVLFSSGTIEEVLR